MAEAITQKEEKSENCWREYPATMEMYDTMRDNIVTKIDNNTSKMLKNLV